MLKLILTGVAAGIAFFCVLATFWLLSVYGFHGPVDTSYVIFFAFEAWFFVGSFFSFNVLRRLPAQEAPWRRIFDIAGMVALLLATIGVNFALLFGAHVPSEWSILCGMLLLALFLRITTRLIPVPEPHIEK